MFDSLVVTSSVGIHEGCDITFDVQGSGEVFVSVSGKGQPFELFFEAETLRAFLARGAEALVEMDARAAKDEAGWDALEQARLAQALDHTAERTG